jgi:nucleoid DNA-binding protein
MLEIATHIERLLLVNNCVIIPGFGGFVLQDAPAAYDRDAHLFRPAGKEIVFNPTLNHDDGLLADAYGQTFGLTFSHARSALAKDVAQLNDALDQHATITLRSIGAFRREPAGSLAFIPAPDRSRFSPASYGLASFNLPPIPVVRHISLPSPGGQRPPSPAPTPRVVYLPVNRTLAYLASISVAAVALSLIITTPLADVDNPASYTAGFAPTEIVRKITPVPAAATPDSAVVLTPVATPAPPRAIAVEQATDTRPALTYYVIIGSFLNEHQARTFADRVDAAACTAIGIIQNDTRIRVYAGKYTNLHDAQQCLEQFRADDRFKDAWLHTAR